nr:Ig-like domain-containing protein [Myxococcota bacterium]
MRISLGFSVSLAFATVLATMLARPGSVAACAAPPDLVRHTLPADGATDVPLDAHMTLVYVGLCDAISPCDERVIPEVVLVDETGAPIDVEITADVSHALTILVVRPNALLAPDARYEVRDVAGCAIEDCAPRRAAAFT